MKNDKWFRPEDVENMSRQERISLSRDYVNPGMTKLFGVLGFDRFWGERAEGLYIDLGGGRRLLDMTGGNGVLGLGHNHPDVLAARAKLAGERRLEICKSFLSPYMAALASNMAALLPGDLQYSYFCNSGAEAIEGAFKMAEKLHGPDRHGIVYTDHSFHGKSHAAMSVSSLDDTRKHFKLLDSCHQVPYGDARALEELLAARCSDTGSMRPDVCAFVLEAVHGSRLIFPPDGYLREVRRICDKYDVVLILDEIYLGFGRTGHWFAFEHEGIVPDIVCYSKTFGGGKATIAGYTARKDVFMGAYGSTGDCMMHSSTFSGMSEECAGALAALEVIRRDGLVERAREMGDCLGAKLSALKEKHPGKIREVRGRGLLWGVELEPAVKTLEQMVRRIMPDKSPVFSTLAGVVVLSELFHSHDILAYLGFTRRNLVVYSPALIVSEADLDRAVDALDKVLSRSWVGLGTAFAARQVTGR